MGLGLSSMEKKKIVVAVTYALLQAQLDTFVPDETSRSPFRLAGAPVAILAPRGMDAFFEQVLYCLEHKPSPFPVPRKKLPPILRMLNAILHTTYEQCVKQLEQGETLNINAYASDTATIAPGTIDINAFIKSTSSALWADLL